MHRLTRLMKKIIGRVHHIIPWFNANGTQTMLHKIWAIAQMNSMKF